MLAHIVRRVITGMVVLVIVSLLVFAATDMLPGDAARAALGRGATDEALANIRERLGLHRPFVIRYLDWLGRLATGDLGYSLVTRYEVSALIGERFWNTLLLAVAAALVSIPTAVAIGLLAAISPGSFFDRISSIATLCVMSVPEYFTAAVLVFFLAVKLQWLPALAYVAPDAGLFERLTALILPVAALSFSVIAHMARMIRAAIINVLATPYVEYAMLKGATRPRVVLFHALPNAVAPIANVIVLDLAYLVTGVVVVEVAFNYPGLATLLIEGVVYRDLPVVQAVAMMFCAVYIGLNLAADVLAMLANPRLRHPA